MLTKYKNFEIISTQYTHPDIKSGQHTNGPPKIWVRELGKNFSAWFPTLEHSMKKVRDNLDKHGIEFYEVKPLNAY